MLQTNCLTLSTEANAKAKATCANIEGTGRMGFRFESQGPGQHCGVVAHIGRRRHLHFLGLNLYGLATPRHVEPEDFLVEDFAFFGLGDHLKGQFVVINEFFEGAGRNMPGKDGHLCSKCVVK